MRESSIFEVRLERFAVWRAVVAALAALALASVLAWAVATVVADDGVGRETIVAITLAFAVATIALAVSLSRVRPGALGCIDGTWTFTADHGAPRAGTLAVALDAGSFLLLRLRSPEGVVWLPVQRRGVERQWHALRCAVYAPASAAARPTTAASAAAGE
jgi:hypothetical protein